MNVWKRDFYRIKLLGLLVLLTVFFCWLIGRMTSASGDGQIVLNEICSSNFTLVRDDNGAYSDYVELSP